LLQLLLLLLLLGILLLYGHDLSVLFFKKVLFKIALLSVVYSTYSLISVITLVDDD